ncbi:hypothetical protein VRB37_16630 [Erwinia billingiae]|uniref:hypothetical protein n=1 Tax=Erwinia billingiae TaxID=182337 RepID=UPI0030CEBEBF
MSIEWDGEGLPPVGCECEWLASGDHDWLKIRVLDYNEDEVWLLPLNGAQSFTVGNPDGFRPFRTEEERRRETAAEAIKSLIIDFDLAITEQRGAEINIAIDIVSAIAAGKIPGIRLTDD